jgi:hypothetical protein
MNTRVEDSQYQRKLKSKEVLVIRLRFGGLTAATMKITVFDLRIPPTDHPCLIQPSSKSAVPSFHPVHSTVVETGALRPRLPCSFSLNLLTLPNGYMESFFAHRLYFGKNGPSKGLSFPFTLLLQVSSKLLSWLSVCVYSYCILLWCA